MVAYDHLESAFPQFCVSKLKRYGGIYLYGSYLIEKLRHDYEFKPSLGYI